MVLFCSSNLAAVRTPIDSHIYVLFTMNCKLSFKIILFLVLSLAKNKLVYIFLVTKISDPISKRQQTEKIVELDESQYRFALQVLEGPALTLRDFSSLTTTFQLSAISEKETLVMKVEYATEKEAAANMGEIAMQPVLSFVQLLEKLVLES